jgi:hypothetical protein
MRFDAQIANGKLRRAAGASEQSAALLRRTRDLRVLLL